MTEQEAMEIIMQVVYDGEFPLNSNEAFGIACKCIEKQIPKNLVCIEDKFLHCPCCDEALSYKWEKYPTEKTNLDWLKFCWNCGQSLASYKQDKIRL